MEITAGGRTWVVEAHDVEGGGPAADAYCEITFRRPERREDRVAMRWVPRPERLTEPIARRLFELAGERVWQDRRTGSTYRLFMSDEALPEEDDAPGAGRIVVRFQTPAGGVTTRYPLERPLGLASDEELEGLLDAAAGLGDPVGA